MKKIKDNVLYLYLISLGVAMLCLAVVCLIMAAIAYSTNNPTANIGLASLASLVISAVISGITITRIKGDGGIKLAGLVSIAVVLILLLIALIMKKGSVLPSAFMNYGCYVGIFVLSAYIGKKRSGTRRRRR